LEVAALREKDRFRAILRFADEANEGYFRMRMEEIARLADVSIATVSRVMNGSSLVSESTAARVRQVMKETRYLPNNTATSLKSGISRIYGLIIPDITNPFFPEFIKAFESIAIEKNEEILLANSDFHPNGMELSIRRLVTRHVQGVALLVSQVPDETCDALLKNSVPMVTFDRRIIGPGTSDVAIDSWPGMDQAVAHLKGFGHKRIAYIGGIADEPISDHRFQSFLRALKKHDLPLWPELVRVGDYRIRGGESAMSELLSLNTLPTAVIAANDLTAIGAMRVIHERGYSTGRDFSVVGFDDIELSGIISPALTTIALSRVQLARCFFDALESFKRRVDCDGRQWKVDTDLVVRQSTGPAPRSHRKRSGSSQPVNGLAMLPAGAARQDDGKPVLDKRRERFL
jgi:LacI family transcriptional regulator